MKKKESTSAQISGCVQEIVVVLLVDLILALALELLWNWLIPSLFHGPRISYAEAIGLVVLLNFIGGFFKEKI